MAGEDGGEGEIRKRIVCWGAAAALLVAAGEYYLGFHHYYEYERERAAAQNLERSFPALERHLKRAISFSRNPRFIKEMGRLYLEMALAQNEFGTPAGRDRFCGRAREAFEEAIRANPADGAAFFELGKVYMLYNFPLLTYAEKGRAVMKRALELRPADGFLNLNILYIYLTQWERLAEDERAFAGARIKALAGADGGFLDRLRRRWRENYGGVEELERILAGLA